MAKIAFEGVPRTVIDDRELHRPGPTYTIDTLRELQAEQPQARLFLIMGEDQAVSLTRWREWQAIPALATICMAARPAGSADAPRALPPEAELNLLRLPEMPESATEVRARVAAHEGIDHLVPPGVASYIAQHSLYQPA
jgi:nicotinate-nucleotide adenylyltransferase